MFENEVGQIATAAVDQVEEAMYSLLLGYNFKKEKDLAYLASFHARFEQIHPFADGNGRVRTFNSLQGMLKRRNNSIHC
ncbi:filamentation induced by cAMP protein [Streptococcus agalactiae]|nr:filamentation induced by cAMP protein [Streptococcus agalactiae]